MVGSKLLALIREWSGVKGPQILDHHVLWCYFCTRPGVSRLVQAGPPDPNLIRQYLHRIICASYYLASSVSYTENFTKKWNWGAELASKLMWCVKVDYHVTSSRLPQHFCLVQRYPMATQSPKTQFNTLKETKPLQSAKYWLVTQGFNIRSSAAKLKFRSCTSPPTRINYKLWIQTGSLHHCYMKCLRT